MKVMDIIIKENAGDFDREAAMYITRQAVKKRDTAFCLATGDTTFNVYSHVVELFRELKVDYSQCKACNLDEYLGIAPSDERSCYFRIMDSILGKANFKQENIFLPRGDCENPEKELTVFSEKINCFGGIDLLVLGIGSNGHIAFNEPGTPFDSSFRIAPLSEKTRKDKADFFGSLDKVPKFGITMGIKDIMMAKEILLLAKGRAKAEIIKRIIHGPMDSDIPASIVRVHPSLTILLDKMAASLLM